MENSESQNCGCSSICEKEVDEQIKVRPRSPTLLKLKMFAEVFRRKKNVEEKLQKGEYKVSSEDIAKALVDINSK